MSIPKIIHYCWFGGNPLSVLATKCIASWERYCPDYRIIRWDESNFDINSNQYVKEAYDSKKWAFVTDYVRLYVLFEHGGIYMDTDVELIKNIDTFLSHSAFSGFEDENYIPTAIMGATANHRWYEYLLSYYENRHFIKEEGGFDMTTNVATITRMTHEKYGISLDNTYQVLGDGIAIYPKEYFCPKSFSDSKITLTANTYCIHHFNASWYTDEEKRRHVRKILYRKLFGDKVGEYFLEFDMHIYKYGLGTTVIKILRKFKRKLFCHHKNTVNLE